MSKRRCIELLFLVAASAQACSFLAPSDEELLGGGRSNGGAAGKSGGSAGVSGGKAGASGAGEGGASVSGGRMGGAAGAGADGGGAAGNGGSAGAAGAGDAPCESGHHRCGGVCVSDAALESCGAACTPCSIPHNGRATCDGTACGITCDVGFTACDASCVDLRTDPNNCGGCGSDFVCTADEVCQAGKCISTSGCSDGTREGFAVAGSYLNIAGCAAQWPLGSMRAPKTGVACGQGLADCAVPADACGLGWHVCASPPYGAAEIRARASVAECLAQPGAYAAAIGDQVCDQCSPEEPGAGAACCGRNCVQQNGSCVYPEMTAWFGVINGHTNLCGDIESTVATRGVLCCLDP